MLSLEGFLEEEVGLWTRRGGKGSGPNPVPEDNTLLSSLDSLEGRGEGSQEIPVVRPERLTKRSWPGMGAFCRFTECQREPGPGPSRARKGRPAGQGRAGRGAATTAGPPDPEPGLEPSPRPAAQRSGAPGTSPGLLGSGPGLTGPGVLPGTSVDAQ